MSVGLHHHPRGHGSAYTVGHPRRTIGVGVGRHTVAPRHRHSRHRHPRHDPVGHGYIAHHAGRNRPRRWGHVTWGRHHRSPVGNPNHHPHACSRRHSGHSGCYGHSRHSRHSRHHGASAPLRHCPRDRCPPYRSTHGRDRCVGLGDTHGIGRPWASRNSN